MSQFDDDLRHATATLAAEPLPPDILDDALDGPPNRARWAAVAAASAVVAMLAIAVGVAVGELTPAPSPSPSASPSPEPTDLAAPTCDDVAAPAGGGDIVVVYFPCAGPGLEQASGTRSVAFEMGIVERLETALRAFLDGPSEFEQQAGMVGAVPHMSSALLSAVNLSENDGLVTVDFDPGLSEVENLSTSSAGGAFIRPLRDTILGFAEVTAVEFRMGGSCDAFFEFFQSTCQHFAETVEQVSDCPIIPPAELPSGAPITEPRPYPGQPMVSWGSGEDTVTQAPGDRSSGSLREEGTPVTVRGYPGFVRPTGDFPRPLPMEIAWEEEGCLYSVFVALTGGEDATVDYAARFGPPMAQPSPPPAEPVTASVEAEGIRLTVTLDRGRTVFGQRVLGTVVVENVGTDSVFWGHSGTCEYPAYVQVRPDQPKRLEYGRDDWPGEGSILKSVTVDERIGTVDPSFGFLPASWLDFEGTMGCTSDLVISELPAGESIAQDVGWDTLGYYDMPPPPGSYTVDATFGFMSRGAVPDVNQVDDEFVVDLTLAIVVEGPEIDYVAPGEAFDALLADEAYRTLLGDVPRRMWLQSDILFVDGRWETALYFSARTSDSDLIEAIVATVDGRSAVVLGVSREERSPPGG